MLATAETFNLGRRLGMDPKILSDIINTSSGRNWSSEVYSPVPGILPNVPSSNNYRPGFSVDLMSKDLGLAMNAALSSGSTTMLGAIARMVYSQLQFTPATGDAEVERLGQKDFSVVYKWLDNNDTQK